MTREELLATAAAAGFPRVVIRPGETVAAGEEAWRLFVAHEFEASLVRAAAALKDGE